MRTFPGLGQLISASRQLCLAAWPPSVFARSFPRHSRLLVGRLGNAGLAMKQSSISNYFSTKGVTPGKVQASGGIGHDSPGTPPAKRARTATTSPRREANTTQAPEAKPKKRRLQKRGGEVKGERASKACEEGAAAAAAGLEDTLDQPLVHHRVRTVPPAADCWGQPPGALPPGAPPSGVSPKQGSDENVPEGSEGPVLKAATPAKSAPRARRSAKKAAASDSEGEAAASSSSSGGSVESGDSDAEEVATGGGGEAAATTKGKAKQLRSKKAAGSAFDKLMEKKPAVSEKVEGVGGGAVSAAADYRNFDLSAAASWAPGEPVPYGFLADTFEDIAGESKRLLIIQRLVACFRTIIATTPQDLLPAVYLCSNKVAPAHEGLEMGVGDATLMKALAGRKEAAIKKEYEETGDLGVVACSARATQRTMFQPKPLTLASVLATFKKIALVQGQGTQEKRKELIVKLLAAAKQGEAGYIARSLQGSRTGRLRIGLAEKSMLVALAHAVALQQGGEELMQCANTTLANQLEQASAKVRQAYSECPSFDVLVPALLEHGHQQLLQHCHFIPGVPIAPMLAKPTSAVSEVLDKFTDRDFTCEFKYDGERAQVHVLPGTKEVRIYSRNMENNSGKYPDVTGRLPKLLKPGVESVVLDGELVAYDPQTSTILPFQVLSTRARKDVKLDDIKVQVVMYVFDCLFLNGRALLQAPLHERRDAMRQAVREQPGQLHFATTKVSTDLEELQKFLDDAVEAGTEGLIVKTLNDTYEPSKRSSHWLKLKKDYLDSGGDSFDVVPIGAVHGKGKRAGLFGAFLLAVYNEEAEEYQTISKLGTGFSEEALKQLSEELRSHQIDAPRSYYSWSSSGFVPDVWFAPSTVWEVKAADLSISPVYTAALGLVDSERGISIRFPRLLRVREDKKPEDATSAQQVAEMYSNQATAKPSKKAAAASDEED